MHPLLARHLAAAQATPTTAPSDWPAFLDSLDAALTAEAAVRDRIDAELRLAQKLEAVGQLAAGIAHELNTPIQYVGDTLQFLESSVAQIRAYGLVAAAVTDELARQPGCEAPVARLREAAEEADLEYLFPRLPEAFARATEGVERVGALVRAVKEFAHPDELEVVPSDLNRAVETTLTVAKNEYKYVARVRTELGAVPPVTCHLGQITQVLVNLVVNAAHAIADARRAEPGEIVVRTVRDGSDVVISVEDDGVGIPPEVQPRIFDPFFTTKEVGRGTGQGLAIAHAVVERHGGALTFSTELGRGTTFLLRLPIGGAVAAR